MLQLGEFPNYVCATQVAVQKCKDQNARLNKAFQLQAEENTKTEALLHQMMKTTKSLYLTLRAQPNAPDYMDEDFNVSVLMFSLRPRESLLRLVAVNRVTSLHIL